MRAPALTRRLVLEVQLREGDGAGGYADRWEPLGTLWAELRAGAGREREGPGVPMGRVPYRITVPAAPHGALSRPRPDQRFREGARVFAILAVAERDPCGAYLTCFCEEEEPA
ncbi:head-tail adaptor protein [Rhodobaculum claviforme]|uniref:Phage tail protein n=1 Tax=Rhodobaculum claviforme TaxID=1549854 RepID=A0A934TMT5_9RHOB|nr:head-tail adaptor protein [Rhodobaculum claviforme]MBK5928523.1 phage tail protein [Rhodobaculum claviforme]